MTPRKRWISFFFALSFSTLSQVTTAQRVEEGRPLPDPCSAIGGPVSVHVPKSERNLLSLCDGHLLGGGTSQFGQAEPLALASGDFDEDGTPDLVSAFGSGVGGRVTVHRGNVRALWPYDAASRAVAPSAFLASPRTFSLPVRPD
jgi:hypothetical protein